MRTKYRDIFAGILMVMLISVFLTGSAVGQKNTKMKSSDKIKSDNTHVLNGMDFRGKLGAFGDETGKDEEIVFENGTFHSLLCDAYGFTPSKYTVAKNPEGNILFETEALNKNGDKMVWHGVIKLDETGITRRDKIEAYATFVPSGKESMLFWMNGEASKQSMKYSGKDVEHHIDAVSEEKDY